MNTPDTSVDATAPVFVRHCDLEVARLPGIEHRTLAGSAQGLKQIAVWRQTLAAHAETPLHRHDVEEVVLCEDGEGELRIGGQVHRFGRDQSVIVPRNVPHQIVNAGDRPLRLTAVFSAAAVAVFDADDRPMPLPW